MGPTGNVWMLVIGNKIQYNLNGFTMKQLYKSCTASNTLPLFCMNLFFQSDDEMADTLFKHSV